MNRREFLTAVTTGAVASVLSVPTTLSGMKAIPNPLYRNQPDIPLSHKALMDDCVDKILDDLSILKSSGVSDYEINAALSELLAHEVDGIVAEKVSCLGAVRDIVMQRLLQII